MSQKIMLLFFIFLLAPFPARAVDLNDTPVHKNTYGSIREGVVKASYYNAACVNIDNEDNVYISDRYGNLLKFDSAGNFLAHWGGWGSSGVGNGEFGGPVFGIGIDSSHNLYIGDYYNHRVQKFDTNGAYLSQFGSYGTGNGQFNLVRDVAVDSHDNIYVLDRNNHRVQKFDTNGTYLSQFGSYGTTDGKFNYPRGIYIDKNDNLYVADYVNHRIQKFDSTGAYVSKFGTKGSGNGELYYPLHVAVDDTGNIYVADASNYRVQKFDSSGAYITKWGSYGIEDSQFSTPYYIALDSLGNVYVADFYNNRVQQFSSDGVWQKQWGSAGTGNGQLNGGAGLAKDSQDNLYVADGYNHRIQKFDSSGNYLTQWGGNGSADGQMSSPIGITIDASDYIYMAEQGNQRIQKFDSSGNFITKWGSYGSANGKLNNPVQINHDSQGNIYEADSNNRRVQKFDSSGTYLTKLTTDGQNSFNAVDGIAIDSQGNYYVVDYDCHVHHFTPGGVYLAKWGACGNANSQFREPVDVAVDSYDNVYVVDTQNSRIQKFDSSGNYLTQFGTWGFTDGKFVMALGIYIDSRDNIYVSDLNRVQVFGDLTSPAGSVSISGRPLYSAGGSITLLLAADDNHDTSSNLTMQVSENADFSGASWESFNSSKSWPLSSGDGHKRIYTRFKDKNGNISAADFTTITVDTTAPTAFDLISPASEAHLPYDNLRPVFKWRANSTDALSDMDRFSFEVGEIAAGSSEFKLIYKVDDLPLSRTFREGYKYETGKYLAAYEGFGDDDVNDVKTLDNNYILFSTKPSASWNNDENDGKLKEGRLTWKVKACDRAGNCAGKERILYSDTLSSSSLGGVAVLGDSSQDEEKPNEPNLPNQPNFPSSLNQSIKKLTSPLTIILLGTLLLGMSFFVWKKGLTKAK